MQWVETQDCQDIGHSKDVKVFLTNMFKNVMETIIPMNEQLESTKIEEYILIVNLDAKESILY